MYGPSGNLEARPDLDSLKRVGGSDGSASSNTASDESAIHLLAMNIALSDRVSSSLPCRCSHFEQLGRPGNGLRILRSVYGI